MKNILWTSEYILSGKMIKKYSANILHTNKNIGYIHEYTHVFGIADVPKKENIRKWEQ